MSNDVVKTVTLVGCTSVAGNSAADADLVINQNLAVGDTVTLNSVTLTAIADTAVADADLVFAGQPGANDTLTINGTVFTFVAGAPSAGQIQIGASLPLTLDNIISVLNGSADTDVDDATYTEDGTDTLTITHDVEGTVGNAFTVAWNLANGATTANLDAAGAAESGSGTLAGGTGVVAVHPEFNLGANLGETIDRLVASANGSSNTLLSVATYSNVTDTTVRIVYDTAGTVGNNFPVAWTFDAATGAFDGAGAAVSGSGTLDGGDYTVTNPMGDLSISIMKDGSYKFNDREGNGPLYVSTNDALSLNALFESLFYDVDDGVSRATFHPAAGTGGNALRQDS